MAEKMLAVRKVGDEPGLRVVEVDVPRPGPDEVLVRVEAASVCGTDLHIWKWDDWARRRLRPPVTLGHEFAGVVVAIGNRVEHVKPGDYVSAESHITCGLCFYCRTGQAHLCPKTRILGIDQDGAFAEYVVIPEKVVWHNDRRRIPPHIATLQEPFGNAVYATLYQDITGQSVAIMGCGPIGLFSVAIARAAGAAYVYAVDPIEYRRQLAVRMGATRVFDPCDGDLVQELIDANEGYGIDVVLEMSGAPAAINNAFRAVRNGGTVVLFGIPSNAVEIEVAQNLIFKNLTVRALNGRKIFETWYKTRWLLEHGVINLEPLVSHRLPLERIDEAMELLSCGQACKIVLHPPGQPAEAVPPQPDTQNEDPGITGKDVHR